MFYNYKYIYTYTHICVYIYIRMESYGVEELISKGSIIKAL